MSVFTIELIEENDEVAAFSASALPFSSETKDEEGFAVRHMTRHNEGGTYCVRISSTGVDETKMYVAYLTVVRDKKLHGGIFLLAPNKDCIIKRGLIHPSISFSDEIDFAFLDVEDIHTKYIDVCVLEVVPRLDGSAFSCIVKGQPFKYNMEWVRIVDKEHPVAAVTFRFDQDFL